MQQMEISDNEQPRSRQKHSGDANKSAKRLFQLLFLSFGVLCIIQSVLNISLRLTLYSSKGSIHSDCNTTHVTDHNQVKEVQNDCEQKRPGQCNRLEERIIALTRDKNLLEHRITELTNMIKDVQAERDGLKNKLTALSGCVPSQRCPADCMEINSRCYFLSNESKTWQDSRKYCQSNNADLVVINSEQEQRALYRLDGNNYLLFWIGLYNTAGTFKWVDGSALTNPFWQSGQPDYGGPNNVEDCVEMYHHGPVLANWNDAPCGHQLRFMCEKNPCTC